MGRPLGPSVVRCTCVACGSPFLYTLADWRRRICPPDDPTRFLCSEACHMALLEEVGRSGERLWKECRARARSPVFLRKDGAEVAYHAKPIPPRKRKPRSVTRPRSFARGEAFTNARVSRERLNRVRAARPALERAAGKTLTQEHALDLLLERGLAALAAADPTVDPPALALPPLM